ncbi:MAG: hypothetical protein JWN72_2935 [Thermoleophilia bacterium]|nr:hypothetical protein [Thermoleophilia bacterium]
MHRRIAILPALIGVAVALAACSTTSLAANGASSATTTVTETRTVLVTGGHVTVRRDDGRPVVLIAAALGVPTTVFRTAFSGVTPAIGGAEPAGAQVQLNKAALLRVLAPYGVTNERLDEVSNFYRYMGADGATWRQAAARATVTVRDGRVASVRLRSGGAGYSSLPTLRVAGYPQLRLSAKLAYGTNLATNGRIAQISVAG